MVNMPAGIVGSLTGPLLRRIACLDTIRLGSDTIRPPIACRLRIDSQDEASEPARLFSTSRSMATTCIRFGCKICSALAQRQRCSQRGLGGGRGEDCHVSARATHLNAVVPHVALHRGSSASSGSPLRQPSCSSSSRIHSRRACASSRRQSKPRSKRPSSTSRLIGNDPASSCIAWRTRRDKNMWTCRVNRDIRMVVHMHGERATFCHVAHHDPAYDWAERHRLQSHATTGALQFVDVSVRTEEIVHTVHTAEVVEPPLFEHVDDSYLLALGVPPRLVPWVQHVGQNAFLEHLERLPEEAAERLMSLASGEPVAVPMAAARSWTSTSTRRTGPIARRCRSLVRKMPGPQWGSTSPNPAARRPHPPRRPPPPQHRPTSRERRADRGPPRCPSHRRQRAPLQADRLAGRPGDCARRAVGRVGGVPAPDAAADRRARCQWSDQGDRCSRHRQDSGRLAPRRRFGSWRRRRLGAGQGAPHDLTRALASNTHKLVDKLFADGGENGLRS